MMMTMIIEFLVFHALIYLAYNQLSVIVNGAPSLSTWQQPTSIGLHKL